jgi:hypothetical protein
VFYDTFRANIPVEREGFGNGFIAMEFHAFGIGLCGYKMHDLPVYYIIALRFSGFGVTSIPNTLHVHVSTPAHLYPPYKPTCFTSHCIIIDVLNFCFACRLNYHHEEDLGLTPLSVRIGDDDYADDHGRAHHHHQVQPGPAGSPEDVRQSHVFPGYSGSYPPNPNVGGASMPPNMHASGAPMAHSSGAPIAARSSKDIDDEDKLSLFGNIPEAKKRKFILVDDPGKGVRVRVRVTLDTVDIKEIPDSFRKSNSVYPRSWFPLQMQSPPPSAHGSRFFEGDDEDDEVEVEGRTGPGSGARKRGRTMVSVPLADGGEAEVATPSMKKSLRSKEVKLNDLGYRMTWHQSRVFADKTVFLQKAREFLSSFCLMVWGGCVLIMQWIHTATKSAPQWRAQARMSQPRHRTSRPESASGAGRSA